ncbi:unnamed protein product [Symbiodinium microadriaticum]|nr:unnamed protein product [Symbiodinium microadriaticum]
MIIISPGLSEAIIAPREGQGPGVAPHIPQHEPRPSVIPARWPEPPGSDPEPPVLQEPLGIGVAEPVVPECEQIPFLAGTEGRGSEETPGPSGSSSAAGSRALVEQVEPLHVDFLQLRQFIHCIRPQSDPFVRVDRVDTEFAAAEPDGHDAPESEFAQRALEVAAKRRRRRCGKTLGFIIGVCRPGHAIHGCHQKSLQALGRSLEQPHDVAGGADAGQVTGAVSGMSAKVPRLDRWVQTLELVRTHSSYNQLASLAESASVGSSLTPGGDSSPQVAKQMIFAMSEVLSQVDRVMMKKAIKTSISIDKTADYFLLYCRTLTPYGLYDFLGGVEGDVAGDVAAETAAMLKILRRMCTRPEGHRSVDAASIYNHESDRFDSVACSN